MNNINFAFSQLIYQWLNKIAPTYRGVLPAGVKPDGAYLRFDGYLDNFATQFIFAVSIYAPNTTSYSTVIQLSDKIADAIGDGGIELSNGQMRVKIEKGSPFYQDKPDEDLTIRAGYVNLIISVYAVSASVKYRVAFIDYFNRDSTVWGNPKWYASGAKITLPENNYVELGYVFMGWKDGDTLYKAGEEYTVTDHDVDFIADWHELITYTITFIADGDIVGTVEYDILHKDITTPKIPDKRGYIGRWEQFDITTAESDFTVNALYTARPATIYAGNVRAGQKTIIRRV